MTKDLFRLAFEEFSHWNYQEYEDNYLAKLPHRLFNTALVVNPGLASCRGYDELHNLLASLDGRRSRNPELYPHLNQVNLHDCSTLQQSVDALRVHVGLDTLERFPWAEPHFWRLRHPCPAVLHIRLAKTDRHDDVSIPCDTSDPFPFIYRPFPHLFDDIEPRLYRGDSLDGDIISLHRLAKDTVEIIAKYSPELSNAFCLEIGTVAFMPRQLGEAKSFSKRNFYVGGIFVSIADPLALAEQFIHEYYHQSIWPWWMVEPLADLPDESVTTVSPITGRARSAIVMIQALLIYYSLIDFYRFVVRTEVSKQYDQRHIASAASRLEKIELGVCELFSTLRCALQGRPRCAAFIEFLAHSC